MHGSAWNEFKIIYFAVTSTSASTSVSTGLSVSPTNNLEMVTDPISKL